MNNKCWNKIFIEKLYPFLNSLGSVCICLCMIMGESLKCLCMIMGEGDGGSHDVDIILGRGLLNDDAWLQGGRGVKNQVKSDYVIKSERSFILNVTSAKRLFFAVI